MRLTRFVLSRALLVAACWQAVACDLAAQPMIMQNAPRPAADFTRDDGGVQYFNFAIDEDKLAGAPDRSALNQPLDAAARLFVKDGHFYRVGPDHRPNTSDDSRVRLYGVNLTFAANFPSAADAERLALRLRKAGINAVRLHHLDSSPDTQNDPPRSVLTPGPYPSFNPVALARLRNLINALSHQGIYVDLNLHVGYRFRPLEDRLPPLDGKAEATALGAPVHVYTARMVALQEDYARQLIRTLGLKDNPALAMVEINNESSLLDAWQHQQWKQAVPLAYAPELKLQWQQWLVKRYGSTAKACASWKLCDDDANANPEIPLLSPLDGSQIHHWKEQVQGKLRSLSDHLFGPDYPGDLIGGGKALRVRDFLLFLADTDRAYFKQMRQVVQSETDTLVPVTGTQMSSGGVLNYDSQADMDYVDEHYYVDHPDFPGADWDDNDWRIHNSAISAGELKGLQALALLRDVRRPFVVSEYNQPFPNQQDSEILPFMATLAAQQDWDGLFLFDYLDGNTWAATPGEFTLSGDWSKYAAIGQSAMLFRQALVAPLPAQLRIPLAAQTRQAIAMRGFGAYETHLAVRLGVTPELSTQARLGIDLSGQSTLPIQKNPAKTDAKGTLRSPNGEFEFQPQQRVILLRTPQVRGVFGFLMNRRVGDDQLAVELLGKNRGFSSIVLTALDQRPLSQSRQILISAASMVTGTQPGSKPLRPKNLVHYKNQSDWWTLEPNAGTDNKPSGSRTALGPVWMERNQARISLRTQARHLTVYPLDGRGQRLPALDGAHVVLRNGVVTIEIQTDLAHTSPWYEVVADE